MNQRRFKFGWVLFWPVHGMSSESFVANLVSCDWMHPLMANLDYETKEVL